MTARSRLAYVRFLAPKMRDQYTHPSLFSFPSSISCNFCCLVNATRMPPKRKSCVIIIAQCDRRAARRDSVTLSCVRLRPLCHHYVMLSGGGKLAAEHDSRPRRHELTSSQLQCTYHNTFERVNRSRTVHMRASRVWRQKTTQRICARSEFFECKIVLTQKG